MAEYLGDRMTAVTHLACGATLEKILVRKPRPLWITITIATCLLAHLILDKMALFHPPNIFFNPNPLNVLLILINIGGIAYLVLVFRKYWFGMLIAWLGIDWCWLFEGDFGRKVHALVGNWFFSDEPWGFLIEVSFVIAFFTFLILTERRRHD